MKDKKVDRKTPVPHNGRRACLCRNGTYSTKCCKGNYFNQGIGNITLGSEDSAGIVNSQDTTNTITSTSTDVPSLGISIITSIDTTNTIVNYSSTAIVSMAVTDGSYSVGDSLPLVATFNEEVIVDTSQGTPSIDVDIDDNTREFSYTTGSGTEDLTFEYTLVEEDSEFETIEVASNITLNGGTMTDSSNNPIETTTESITIDAENVIPPVESFDQCDTSLYGAGGSLGSAVGRASLGKIGINASASGLNRIINNITTVATFISLVYSDNYDDLNNIPNIHNAVNDYIANGTLPTNVNIEIIESTNSTQDGSSTTWDENGFLQNDGLAVRKAISAGTYYARLTMGWCGKSHTSTQILTTTSL